MSILIDEIKKKINSKRKKNKVFILGIDGPTAAGKTILANNLKKNLQKSKVIIFRLDWTLKSRSQRIKSLSEFKKNNEIFYYEAEDHMNLRLTSEFLKKIFEFNKSNKKNTLIRLKNLYDRFGSSKTDLRIDLNINKNTIIIIEGHYSGYSNIYEYLDYNVLLLSSKKELLVRKIDRVKNYRSSKDTEQYFNLIDVPSFVNYLTRFGNNYNLIVDNTNYNKPKIKNHEYIKKWIEASFRQKLYSGKVYRATEFVKFFKEFRENLFSKKNLAQLFRVFFDIDNFVNKQFTNSIDLIKIDLNEYVQSITNKFDKKLKKTKLEFLYTNSFHNLYYKKLPIILGFKVFSQRHSANIILKVTNNFLEISIDWIGGSEEIQVSRIIGQSLISDNSELSYLKSNIKNCVFEKKQKIKAYIPTDFTYLNFLEDYFEVKKILINQEDYIISAAEIKDRLLSNNILWIQRFAKFSERNFFKTISKLMGCEAFSINNYLFILKSNNFEANKTFRKKFIDWEVNSLKANSIINNSNLEYDLIVDKERAELKKIVNTKTKVFKCLDGQIYLSVRGNINYQKQLRKDVYFLLTHSRRTLRKSIINFLIKNINIQLSAKKLWPDIKDDKKISLKQFINVSPSILSDIYFWLNLKEGNSAILAANVYDIRKDSLDIASYLRVSQSQSRPIVLQSSFNAIGQKEKFKGGISEGYLKLKNGPKEFYNSVMKIARDSYLENFKDFLYGVGLDHVDYRYDKPKGRVNRFLKKFADNTITHFTLDSSYLLEDPKIKNFNKNKKKIIYKVLENEINLLEQIKNNHIYDFEFCANELNYVESEKKVFLPTKNDIKYFADSFFDIISKSKLKYFNSRPKLIIGNLGTVHHGYDKNNYVKTEISKEWIDIVKKFNFISAVLHGTSRSHPDILKRATIGCFKINVAGDFLQVLVSNLPDKVKKIVVDQNDNEKKKLYLIRDQMDKFSWIEKEKIKSALYNKCESLMNLIQTPNLTDSDVNYFKYKNYKIDVTQANYISKEITKEITKEKISFDEKPKKTTHKGQFLLSPIEIKYDNFFKNLVKFYIKNKGKIFHIDIGDGKLIDRVIDATDKVKFIKKVSKKNVIHLHLMVKKLDDEKIYDKYINHYIKLGVDCIGLHIRSFENFKNLENTIDKIKSMGVKPGIVLEINDDLDNRIMQIILKKNINWIVFMGVPIGYGGQLFNQNIIPKIIKTKNFIKKNKLKINIEVDGGLTLETLKLLKNLNINFYAGWSIIKGHNIKAISRKLNEVKKVLK